LFFFWIIGVVGWVFVVFLLLWIRLLLPVPVPWIVVLELELELEIVIVEIVVVGAISAFPSVVAHDRAWALIDETVFPLRFTVVAR